MTASCVVWSQQSPELRTPQGEGLVGLGLKLDANYPVVAWIAPDGPAAQEGGIQTGDTIVAISELHGQAEFASTKGKTLQEVVGLLKGIPGTEVIIRSSTVTLNGSVKVRTTRLRRREMSEFHLSSGLVMSRFLGTNWHPIVLSLSEAEIARLRHVDSAQWSRVTNSMLGEDVVKIIGQPLRVENSMYLGERSWRYGWLVHVGNEKLPPGEVELVVSNGIVSRAFQIIQPDDRTICRVELLSMADH